MARRKVRAGIVSMILPVFVHDVTSTVGGGLSGLTAASSGLVCKYRRSNSSTSVAVPLSAGTLGTWGSGTLVAGDGPTGDYQLALPNAAFAAGAQWVVIWLYGATNMLSIRMEFELDAVDYQDAAAFGLSNLDATVSSRSTLTAAQVWANATRTLSSFGTLASDVWTNSTRTLSSFGTLASDVWANPTRTLSSFGTLVADTATAVWGAGTRTLTGFGTLVADVWANAARTITGGTISTVGDKTGYSLTAAYDASKTAATQTSVDASKAILDKVNSALEADGGVYRFTANALEQAPADGGGSTDANAVALAVWSAATRTLTSTGVLPQIIVAGEDIGGETMNLIQRSARNYVCTVPGIPVGATVVKAYFVIKIDLTDDDEAALLKKTISPALSAEGQITDDGHATQSAVLDFAIDNDDLDALPLDTVLQSAVKVVLSTGAAYTPPLLFRPVVVWPWGVYAIN